MTVRGRRWMAVGLTAFVLADVAAVAWLSRSTGTDLRTLVEATLERGRGRGFLFRTHVDAAGTRHRYALFVPYEMRREERRPLLLFLNGFGKNGDDGIAPLYDGIAPVIWERKRDFPSVVVFPQCHNGESWEGTGAAARRALAIVDEVQKEFQTDPDRVYLTGLSSGGWGAWSLGAARPERFAAVVPVSSSEVSRETLETIARVGLPTWSFYVRGDAPGLVSANREMHRALLELGASPMTTELDGTFDSRLNTHNAWDCAFRDPALYAWLLRQRRDSIARDAPGAFVRLAWDDATLRLGDEGGWRLDGNGVLSADSAAASDASTCSLGRWPVPFDFHIEFNPTREARYGLIVGRPGDESEMAAARIEICGSRFERGGAFDSANGAFLAPNAPAAEASVRPGEWNELRVRLDRGTLSILVNQWTLVEIDAFRSTPDAADVALFAAGGEGAGVRWRNPRSRPARVDAPHPIRPEHLTSVDLRRGTTFTLDDAVAAWRRREEAARAVRLTWRQDRSNDGAWSAYRSASPLVDEQAAADAVLRISAEKVGHEEVLPARAFRRGADGRLVCGASQPEFMKCLDERRDMTGARATPARLRTCLTPEQTTTVFLAEDGSPPHATISANLPRHPDRIGNLDDLMWRAPLLFFRPLESVGFGADPKSLAPVGTARIGGADCIVLRETYVVDAQTVLREFCVDAAREFAVLRYVATLENGCWEQVDVEYHRDDDLGWAPRAWTVLTNRRFGAFSSDLYPGLEECFDHAAAAVTGVEWNSSEGADDVESWLPDGTIICDNRTGRWYEQRSATEARTLSQGEIADWLFASDTSGNGASRGVRGREGLIVCAVCGLALALLGLRMRHRRAGRLVARDAPTQ